MTIWANCGEMFDCMNNGTTIGENIIHFVVGLVKNKLAIAISIRVTIISGIPLKFKYSNKLANHAVIIIPIFVCLNIAMNWDTTNININHDKIEEWKKQFI